jgi:LPXTG-motif cell wall-anchored protein
VARAAQEAPTVTGGEDQENTAAGPIASLPLTGLQLAAVAAAGLCLLVAGALLRPRRRPVPSR